MLAVAQGALLIAIWDGQRSTEIDAQRLEWQQRVRQARAVQERVERRVIEQRSLAMVFERSRGSKSVTQLLSALASVMPSAAYLRELQISMDQARGSLIIVSEGEIAANEVLAQAGLRATDMNVMSGEHARQQIHAISFEFRPAPSETRDRN